MDTLLIHKNYVKKCISRGFIMEVVKIALKVLTETPF